MAKVEVKHRFRTWESPGYKGDTWWMEVQEAITEFVGTARYGGSFEQVEERVGFQDEAAAEQAAREVIAERNRYWTSKGRREDEVWSYTKTFEAKS